MDYSTPGLPVHHQLLEVTQTHDHPVNDVIQPSDTLSSNYQILCHPLLLPSIFPSIRVFSSESALNKSLLLLLLSHFSRVQLCATPETAAPGILQARTLEWVAISFSNAWKWKVKVKSLSHARLLATPWTAAYQPPPSMGFARQEYWSGLPLPSPNKSLLLLLLSHFSRVQLCATPETAAPGILQARTLEWVAISFSKTVTKSFLIWVQ